MASIPGKEGLFGCKVVFLKGKGYCIIPSDVKEEKGGYYKLPVLDITIDKTSYMLFRSPQNKAFIAVRNEEGEPIYVLRVIGKDKIDLFRRGMESKELDISYSRPKTVGKGSYGRVDILPTQDLAIKISIQDIETGGISQDIVKEIAVYRLLGEITCLPRLVDFEVNPVKLAFEAGSTTLDNAIVKSLLIEKNMRQIMLKSVKCLSSINSQGVMHLDLKPANLILLEEDDQVSRPKLPGLLEEFIEKDDSLKTYSIQIIDWGLCEIDKTRNQTRPKSVRIQTIWYRAPEILLYNLEGEREGIYDHKVDIFSLGLIFAEMYTGSPLVIGEEEEHQAYGLLRILLDVPRETIQEPEETIQKLNYLTKGESVADKIQSQLIKVFALSPILADLISRMLDFNPKHRIDYDEIVLHPYFQNIRRQAVPKLPMFINEMPKIPDMSKVYGERYRNMVLSWVRDICKRHKKDLEMLCLSFQLIDLYVFRVGVREIGVTKLQLVACSSMYLASNLYDYTPFSLKEMVYWSDNTYTVKQVSEMASNILQVLEGNLLIPTLYSYYSNERDAINNPNQKEYKSFLDMYLKNDVYA